MDRGEREVRPGADGRSGPAGPLPGETRRLAGRRRAAARRDRELRGLLQRVELHFSARCRPPSITARPARARRSSTSPATCEQQPDDLGVQWLLNVAYMTLGEYPEGVPPDLLLPLGRFADGGRRPATDGQRGLAGRAQRAGRVDGRRLPGRRLRRRRPARRLHAHDRARAGGTAFCATAATAPSRTSPESAGLDDQVLSLNACHADFDNDGTLDILMLRGAWEVPRRMSLLRNRGGTFDDVTLSAGLGEPIATQAAGWADYDNDGQVDLYVAGEFDLSRPDPRNRGRLYHNRGDGTFENVAVAAGVTNDRFGKGVAWGDYDDDGRPDLYVSNLGQPNRLYHNQGDGTFVDVAAVLKVTGADRQLRVLVLGLRQRRPPRPLGQPLSFDALRRHRRPARPADSPASGPGSIATSAAGTIPGRDGRGRARPRRPANGLATSATSITTAFSTCTWGPAGRRICT